MMTKEIKRDLPECGCFDVLRTGMLVRCWDHCPDSTRPDRYVEGIVKDIENDDMIVVHVVKDSCFPLGTRLEISTPVSTIFGEYAGRIQILGSHNGRELILSADPMLEPCNAVRPY